MARLLFDATDRAGLRKCEARFEALLRGPINWRVHNRLRWASRRMIKISGGKKRGSKGLCQAWGSGSIPPVSPLHQRLPRTSLQSPIYPRLTILNASSLARYLPRGAGRLVGYVLNEISNAV